MSQIEAGEADHRVVVEALDRVLHSELFSGAPRSRALLAFVVTETINGRGDSLNQRILARVVLGRPASVDTRTDASVRVQARRLRDLLDRYYEGEGRHEQTRIDIPIGQYAATFRPNMNAAQALSPAAPNRNGGPVVAVLQLRYGAAGLQRRVAAGLTESIVHAMARCPGLRVVGPLAPEPGKFSQHAGGVARHVTADFVLHGGVVRLDDRIRVTWHLAETASQAVVWSDSFERRPDEFNGFAAEDEITRRVVAAIADFSGVVLRAPVPHRVGAEPIVADALRRYYTFTDDLDPVQRPEIIAGLKGALEAEPHNAHVAACLAHAVAVDVLQRGAAATESLREARRYGRLAVQLDTSEPTAHNVLGIVALAEGDLAGAAQYAEAALRLAPMHPDTVYVAGVLIAAATDWQRGIALIRDVVSINPFGSNPRRTWLAMDALVQGDASNALAQASLLHYPGYVHGHVIRAICYDRMGLDELAASEIEMILDIDPSFFEHAEDVLGAVPTVPGHIVDQLVEHLSQVKSVGRSDRTGAEV